MATGLAGINLPKEAFSNARLRGIIGRRGRLDKGRVVVCRRMSDGEVYAAVAVHVSEQRRAPIIVQEILMRTDPGAREHSRRCVIWILGMLLEAADADEPRPALIGVEIDKHESDADYVEIGFVKCARPLGYKPERPETTFYAVWR